MIDSFNNDICFIANLIPVPTTYPSPYLPYLLSCTHYLGQSSKKGGNPSSFKAKGGGRMKDPSRRSPRGLPAHKYNDDSSVESDDGYDGDVGEGEDVPDDREGENNHNNKSLDDSLTLMTFTATITTPYHRMYVHYPLPIKSLSLYSCIDSDVKTKRTTPAKVMAQSNNRAKESVETEESSDSDEDSDSDSDSDDDEDDEERSAKKQRSDRGVGGRKDDATKDDLSYLAQRILGACDKAGHNLRVSLSNWGM